MPSQHLSGDHIRDLCCSKQFLERTLHKGALGSHLPNSKSVFLACRVAGEKSAEADILLVFSSEGDAQTVFLAL